MKLLIKSKKLQTKILVTSLDTQILSGLIPEKTTKIIVFVDKNLAHEGKRVQKLLTQLKLPSHVVEVQAGEKLKDFQTIGKLHQKLLDLKADRRSLLIAVGGGTVGDSIGFLASTYMRGLPWIGIPTTLLSQVDSCLGGKTAVNLPGGKNLVGTFHHPIAVVCDTRLLKSLGKREMISGLGEMIKYGLIEDPKFFRYLSKHWRQVLKFDKEVSEYCVSRCLEIKAKLVSQDPDDLTGIREKLNFGHTLAHGLEQVTNFKGFQHGEAVLWGLRYELLLSEELGLCPSHIISEALNFLQQLPLPPLPAEGKFEALMRAMSKDKKNFLGKIKFLTLIKLGKVSAQEVEDKKLLLSVYKRLRHER